MHWTRRYLFGKALFKKSNCEGLEWLLPFWHNSLSWIRRAEILCFVRCWSVDNDGKKKRTTLRHDTTLTNSRYAAPRRNRSQIYKFSRNFWLVLHTERKRERRVNISMKIAGKNERERERETLDLSLWFTPFCAHIHTIHTACHANIHMQSRKKFQHRVVDYWCCCMVFRDLIYEINIFAKWHTTPHSVYAMPYCNIENAVSNVKFSSNTFSNNWILPAAPAHTHTHITQPLFILKRTAHTHFTVFQENVCVYISMKQTTSIGSEREIIGIFKAFKHFYINFKQIANYFSLAPRPNTMFLA